MISTLVDLVRLAVPNVFSFLIMYLGSVVTVGVVSALNDPVALGAVGLGSLVVNVFGFAVACGLTSVLDTLVSQSVGNKAEGVRYLHKARLVVLVVFLPSVAILSRTSAMLTLCGQDELTGSLAQEYVNISVLGMLPSFDFFALSSYLRASWNPTPAAVVNTASALVHSLASVVLVLHFRLDVRGPATATALTGWLRFLLLEGFDWRSEASLRGFVKWCKHEFSSVGNFRVLISEMRSFLHLAIPSFALQFCEWVAYELQALIAGLVGVPSLAANVVASNVVTIAFMIPVGISHAASTVVGSALGTGEPDKAKKAAGLSAGFVFIVTLTLSYYIISCKTAIINLYTSESAVVEALDQAFTVVAAFVVADGVQGVLEGVLRGLRMQREAVTWKLVAMIGIRLPLGYVLAVHSGLGVAGVWLGACAGMAFSAVVYAFRVAQADYTKAAVEAMKLTRTPLSVASPLFMTAAAPIELDDPTDFLITSV